MTPLASWLLLCALVGALYLLLRLSVSLEQRRWVRRMAPTNVPDSASSAGVLVESGRNVLDGLSPSSNTARPGLSALPDRPGPASIANPHQP